MWLNEWVSEWLSRGKKGFTRKWVIEWIDLIDINYNNTNDGERVIKWIKLLRGLVSE